MMRRPLLALAFLVALAGSGVATSARATNDSLFSGQWNVGIIGAPSSWERGGTGAGVTIGIVDTGIDLAHEDLAGRIVATTDCTHQTGGDPAKCSGVGQDDSGHGTHVAGIAVADTSNGRGVAGIAYDSKVVVAKVLTYSNGSATGDLNDVGAGIRWVVQHGAKVVNLSLGIDDSNVGGTVATLSDTRLQAYITEAWNAGAVPVVAAGNNGDSSPSNYNNVNAIVVTATTKTDTQASYASQTSGSLSQAKYAMAAPGGEKDGQCPGAMIASTWWDRTEPGVHDTYACLTGTSMAAPHVSAGAAILLGLGLTRDQTVQRMLSTAKTVGPSSTFGSGRLDLAAATAGLGHEPATTAPTTTAATTRPARVRSAAAARPVTKPKPAAPAPTTTATTQAPATTTTTELSSTTTSRTDRVLASAPIGNDAGAAKRRAAIALATAGVLAMGASSTVALRRRRVLRPPR
jgi:subtilisin family serine protease